MFNASNDSDNIYSRFGGKSGYVMYYMTMLVILIAGISGNGITIVICRRPEHRKKEITPLLINLAVADLIIVTFGYSLTFTSNIRGAYLVEGDPLCYWSAIVNGTVGIGSIGTMVVVNILIYKSTRRNIMFKLSPRTMAVAFVGIWTYSACVVFPPLFGWNRIVPGTTHTSCEPDWSNQTSLGLSYNIYMMVFGFFLPLICISFTFYRIRKCLAAPTVLQNTFKKRAHVELVRMMTGVVTAFTLSWSPYAIVCLKSMVVGKQKLAPFTSEVTALMAKASAVYNPIVYVVLSKRFRSSLVSLVVSVAEGLLGKNRIRPLRIQVAPSASSNKT
ncbi:green-sensitive opsin-1 [Nematostella vectensis]|uniref:green-sensitive opsin-1 n=1 Tax=Nematostella vectensis TaxID=45351 RepID=UPI0020771597|nr:green-sensitive opsin-1 [Nematostella vectensis]